MQLIHIYGLYDPRTDEIRYIGKTSQPLNQRLNAHLVGAKRGDKSYKCSWIINLLNDGVRPEIVSLEIATEDTWEEAEKRWIALGWASGLRLTNLTDGGESPTIQKGTKQSDEHVKKRVESRKKAGNYKHTEEAKQRMSDSTKGTQVGEKNPFFGKKHTEETLDKMRAKQKQWRSEKPNPWLGRKHSEEAKQKISKAKKGAKWTKEQKQKLKGRTPWNKGKKLSEEHRRKITEANMNRPDSVNQKIGQSMTQYYIDHPEAKEHLSEINKGKTHSEETKQKLSEAAMGHEVSPETRAKMSKAKKGKPTWIKGKTQSPEHIQKRVESRHKTMKEKVKAAWAERKLRGE